MRSVHELRAVFQEENDAFDSALRKIDVRDQNDKPPVEVVNNDQEFELLDGTTDTSIWTDASMFHYGIYI